MRMSVYQEFNKSTDGFIALTAGNKTFKLPFLRTVSKSQAMFTKQWNKNTSWKEISENEQEEKLTLF